MNYENLSDELKAKIYEDRYESSCPNGEDKTPVTSEYWILIQIQLRTNHADIYSLRKLALKKCSVEQNIQHVVTPPTPWLGEPLSLLYLHLSFSRNKSSKVEPYQLS